MKDLHHLCAVPRLHKIPLHVEGEVSSDAAAEVCPTNLSQINSRSLSVSDTEQEKWDQVLREHGLGMGRGQNRDRLFYGSNDRVRLKEVSWDDAKIFGKPRKPRTQPKSQSRLCVICNQPFSSQRNDATTCSVSCRKRKQRGRHK